VDGQPDAKLFSSMKWRLIGPFRGGRVTAVAGVPQARDTYYFGTPGGGVWKTTDGGQVWRPIFDSVPVPSIGALAVAPSDPRIIYVGTGEQTRGRGVYRSSDAGATWTPAGLADIPFLQEIIVDPRDPDVVVAAGNTLGMGILWRPFPPYATTDNRGIFRTVDGGKAWKKVYENNDTIGVMDMCTDPDNPSMLYASLYRLPSGEGDTAVAATSDIVRSTDGGATWAPLQSKGLPDKARGRLGIIVAPGTGGRRLYAIVDQGFYRSDDGGANWYQSTKDPRVMGSNYFSRVFVDTQNPDTVYVAQTSLYRSTDGGKTFEAYVGAPSGDDFHVLWIDPHDGARMILGVDQGAVITVDAGKTWSSWYNQPTGQFYHVSTDNQFPYRAYAAQQDSGTAGVLSRSDNGQILSQDWFSIGGFEYAFITPDPAHPNWIYSNGWYGSVVRYDRNTTQTATVFEHGSKYRVAQMAPLVFSPQDPGTLYFGTQYVLKTTDSAKTWQPISPDLTGYVEPKETEKPDPDKPRPPAITAIAPSPLTPAVIWAGTSNGLVHLTSDGGANWANVSPPGLADPLQVLYIEPSHHDPAAAYAVVGATRFSTPPNILRTRDSGKSWQKIVNGFPGDHLVRVVREDPKRPGLLYAGTDIGIFVSWDDGDNWQPFSLNLPPAPVTDLQVHGDDLAASTFGRGLWILDNLTALRDMNAQVAAADVHLFPPATAMRVRWDTYEDTPYPIETPAGQNPPDGAILDYFLKAPASGELTLRIVDESGNEVASFSSEPKPIALPPANAPEYWFAPQAKLSNAAGINRFVWDLRNPAPPTLPYGYSGELLEYTEYTLPDHAVPDLTPRLQPQGALVVPGKYTLELQAGGSSYRQTLAVELDPRAKVSSADLEAQRDLALRITRGLQSSTDAYYQADAMRKALGDSKSGKDSDKTTSKGPKADLQKKLRALLNGTKSAPGFGLVNRDLARLMFSVESADFAPTESVRAAVQESCQALGQRLREWRQINQQDAVALKSKRAAKQTAPLPVVVVALGGCEK
jgi:photosystem II stability/assembly factor-like uncharacterized protein